VSPFRLAGWLGRRRTVSKVGPKPIRPRAGGFQPPNLRNHQLPTLVGSPLQRFTSFGPDCQNRIGFMRLYGSLGISKRNTLSCPPVHGIEGPQQLLGGGSTFEPSALHSGSTHHLSRLPESGGSLEPLSSPGVPDRSVLQGPRGGEVAARPSFDSVTARSYGFADDSIITLRRSIASCICGLSSKA